MISNFIQTDVKYRTLVPSESFPFKPSSFSLKKMKISGRASNSL